MVEQQLPKLNTRVRFPSPAPFHSHERCALKLKWAAEISMRTSDFGFQNSVQSASLLAEGALLPPMRAASFWPSARTGEAAGRALPSLAMRMAGLDAEIERVAGRGAVCEMDDAAATIVPVPVSLNWVSSWFNAAASVARLWLAAVLSSTMAAFCCVPWSMVLTAVLISCSPVDCSRDVSTIACDVPVDLLHFTTIASQCLAGFADQRNAARDTCSWK